MSDLTIRDALPNDTSTILGFINDLAVYEKEPDAVEATEQHIQNTLFCANPKVNGIICEHQGQPIGFAVFFFNYSTWLGKHGLYLEDLYVAPEKRGLGAGKLIMQWLAKHALQNNCGRFEWSVLDWNQPAIEFYQSIGAKPQNEWMGYRLNGKALHDFANQGDTLVKP